MLDIHVLFAIILAGFSRKVQGNGHFCGPDIALNKPATQSPGTYCDKSYSGSEYICYNASKAVDGISDNGDFSKGLCSHTSLQYENGASWSVNLGMHYYITGIRIYNRAPEGTGPTVGNRLRDFSIYGLTEWSEEMLVYQFPFVNLNQLIIQIDIPLTGLHSVSGLRIEIPQRESTEMTILSLCEVEVYSGLYCPQLYPEPPTFVRYTNGTNIGSIALFDCQDGYHLNGQIFVICEGVDWSDQAPTCEKNQMCKPLHTDEFANYSQPSVKGLFPYGTSVNVTCSNGTDYQTSTILTCMANGTWKGKLPGCEITPPEKRVCRSPGFHLDNVTIIIISVSAFGSVLVIVCALCWNKRPHIRTIERTASSSERSALIPRTRARNSYTETDEIHGRTLYGGKRHLR